MPALATRFGRRTNVLRSAVPLCEEEIRRAAPSIYAVDKHCSRSQRYTYIPTSEVLRGLEREGFQPFMVAQARVRDDGKREHAKHLIRLRHASQIAAAEANEICLLNSHDGMDLDQVVRLNDPMTFCVYMRWPA